MHSIMTRRNEKEELFINKMEESLKATEEKAISY